MKNARLPLYITLGVIFWLSAALTVRTVGNTVFSENNAWLFLFFVLGFPITWGFLFVTKKAAGIEYGALLEPVVIMTFTATMLDGVALAWFRHLYGPTHEIALYGAAWILWGAGLGLLFAYVLKKRTTD